MSRLIAGLFVAVLAATSFADTPPSTSEPVAEPAAKAAKPADSKFPLKVVKLLPESEQALLFDAKRGRHVLVEVGETVGDYTVSAISADEVTLVGKDMPVEIALYAAKPKAKAPVAKAPPKPADPYADDVAVAEADSPADPYADVDAAPLVEGADEPRIVSADGTEEAAEQAVENTIRATQWGTSKADGTKSTTSPFANMSADAAKPSEEVANAGKPVEKQADADPKPDARPEVKADGPTQLSKKEVNAALTDFAKLAASIDGSFAANGLVLEKVQAGSVFAKAGLVAGDVITAVDGKPLKSIDDAADLYARAGGMKSATVQIVRAGAPKTLRIAIQ